MCAKIRNQVFRVVASSRPVLTDRQSRSQITLLTRFATKPKPIPWPRYCDSLALITTRSCDNYLAIIYRNAKAVIVSFLFDYVPTLLYFITINFGLNIAIRALFGHYSALLFSLPSPATILGWWRSCIIHTRHSVPIIPLKLL